jgi:HK97 family phage prohead protease
MIRRFATLDEPATLAELGQFRGVASTEAPGDDGYIVRTAGITMDRYNANPVLLYQHDPDKPVGTASKTWTTGGELHILGQFAPEGTSAAADEARRLVAAGVLRGLSMGFAVLESKPITVDGERMVEATKVELFEISLVSIPLLPGAVISERTARRSGEHPEGSRAWFRERIREHEEDRRHAIEVEREALRQVSMRNHARRIERAPEPEDPTEAILAYRIEQYRARAAGRRG